MFEPACVSLHLLVPLALLLLPLLWGSYFACRPAHLLHFAWPPPCTSGPAAHPVTVAAFHTFHSPMSGLRARKNELSARLTVPSVIVFRSRDVSAAGASNVASPVPPPRPLYITSVNPGLSMISMRRNPTADHPPPKLPPSPYGILTQPSVALSLDGHSGATPRCMDARGFFLDAFNAPASWALRRKSHGCSDSTPNTYRYIPLARYENVLIPLTRLLGSTAMTRAAATYYSLPCLFGGMSFFPNLAVIFKL